MFISPLITRCLIFKSVVSIFFKLISKIYKLVFIIVIIKVTKINIIKEKGIRNN